MTDDINDVRHTSTLAKFEEAVRKDERSRISPVSETARRKERISMAKEICSHRGEYPNSVDRGGNEGWEKYEPLAGACIREAERLFALRGFAQRPAEPITAEQFARWFYFDCEQPVYVCGDLAEEIMKYFEVRPLPGVELVPPAPADTSTDRPAQPQPSDVVQHVAWLNQYIIGMDENNWKDMRLRAERQLEELSVALSISRPLRQSQGG